MKYKEALKQSMNTLATNKKTLFIGYNTRCGGMANGTLVDVPKEQLIETPVAENLMVGMAIGLSLEGYNPIVYFERCDFILNALDSIVNHLDKIRNISDKQYDPIITIRVVVGGTKKPLFTGPTHTQDFKNSLIRLVEFPVVGLLTSNEVIANYKHIVAPKLSHILLEYRDLYDTE